MQKKSVAPVRQRPALQNAGELCRAKDSSGNQPPRIAQKPEGRSVRQRQGSRTAGGFPLRTAELRGQVAPCRQPASRTRPQ